MITVSTKEIGCPKVWPPEIFNDKVTSYDERIDIWYIGVIALFLFSNNIEAISAKKKDYWMVSAEPQDTQELKQ